jgi:hypothetical protein
MAISVRARTTRDDEGAAEGRPSEPAFRREDENFSEPPIERQHSFVKDREPLQSGELGNVPGLLHGFERLERFDRRAFRGATPRSVAGQLCHERGVDA